MGPASPSLSLGALAIYIYPVHVGTRPARLGPVERFSGGRQRLGPQPYPASAISPDVEILSLLSELGEVEARKEERGDVEARVL